MYTLRVHNASLHILHHLGSVGKDNICALDCWSQAFICIWIDRDFAVKLLSRAMKWGWFLGFCQVSGV